MRGKLCDTRGQRRETDGRGQQLTDRKGRMETKEPGQRFLAENGRLKGIRLRKQLCLIAAPTLLPSRLWSHYCPGGWGHGRMKSDRRSLSSDCHYAVFGTLVFCILIE